MKLKISLSSHSDKNSLKLLSHICASTKFHSLLGWGYCNQLYFFVASLRNFGERTVNLFSRKKKNTEQNAQDLVNQTEDAAVSLKNDLKNDANDIGENTGYYLCLSHPN